jgi:hypothetical protein
VSCSKIVQNDRYKNKSFRLFWEMFHIRSLRTQKLDPDPDAKLFGNAGSGTVYNEKR